MRRTTVTRIEFDDAGTYQSTSWALLCAGCARLAQERRMVLWARPFGVSARCDWCTGAERRRIEPTEAAERDLRRREERIARWKREAAARRGAVVEARRIIATLEDRVSSGIEAARWRLDWYRQELEQLEAKQR